MIYFDNAATSFYKPNTVINNVNYALKNLSANPGRSGHNLSLKSAQAVYKTREKVASFFGASSPDKVIFTKNCTESTNIVIKGVLEPYDSSLISCFEHNAVARPFFRLSNEGRNEYKVVDVFKKTDEEIVKEFEKNITEKTKLIFCTHASNVFGVVLPIEKIGKLCKERNLLFAVDAAQTGGVLPIDMKSMNIDYLCIAPHKGLLSPMGAGILIAEKPFNKTLTEGGTGVNSMSLYQSPEIPEGIESGTLPLPSILGISGGIDYLNRETTEKIYAHEMKLAKKLYSGLMKTDGVILYTEYPEDYKSVPVISFNIKNHDSNEIGEMLNEKGIAVRSGIHCSPLAHTFVGTKITGTVRVSFGVNNTESEVNRLLGVINNIIYK